MSQSDLARELGCHRSQISRICADKRGVSVSDLQKIAVILETTVGELLPSTDSTATTNSAGQ